MIIFVAGFPYSGKSFVVQKILDKISNCIVISAKDFRPDEYDTLNEEEQRELNISAWICSLEQLDKAITEFKNDRIIIYDTSCASYDKMCDYFLYAKNKGHKVIYLYIHSSLEKCRERAGQKWFNKEVEDKYKSSFKISIPKLSAMADKHIIINNINGEINLCKFFDAIGQ